MVPTTPANSDVERRPEGGAVCFAIEISPCESIVLFDKMADSGALPLLRVVRSHGGHRLL